MSVELLQSMNWQQRLEWAEANSPPASSDEHRFLMAMANGWGTAPTADLCKALPCDDKGAPVDAWLQMFKEGFVRAAEARRWSLTRFYYKGIEVRTAQILDQNGA